MPSLAKGVDTRFPAYRLGGCYEGGKELYRDLYGLHIKALRASFPCIPFIIRV